MNNNLNDGPVTLASTAGGVLLVIINLQGGEILKTVVLAAVGAVVSFTVSLVLRYTFKWLIKRR